MLAISTLGLDWTADPGFVLNLAVQSASTKKSVGAKRQNKIS
jgi:hypothetical protein